MSTTQLMTEIDHMIDDAKTAVLATVDSAGAPHVRWITPCTLSDHPGALYMVTAQTFAKVSHAERDPQASIMLQTRLLTRVCTLQGSLVVLRNPLLRSEILERVSSRLHAFWKIKAPQKDLVVLEFTITSAVLYLPMEGKKSEFTLTGEGS